MGLLRPVVGFPLWLRGKKLLLRCHHKLFLLLFVLGSLGCANAQYEVPDEIFQRTLLVRAGKEEATAFKFDQGGTIYLVTTRHFGKTLPVTKAVVEVWHDQAWNELHTVRTFFPAAKDADLAILETGERIANHYAVVPSTEVLTTGQKVWYMGWVVPVKFPPDMFAAIQKMNPQRSPFKEIPYVSIGNVTAIEPTRADAFEINTSRPYSERISGGPVIYWSPVHNDYEILGVIERNTEKVEYAGSPAQNVVKSVSLKAYSIDLVVDTIKDNSRP